MLILLLIPIAIAAAVWLGATVLGWGLIAKIIHDGTKAKPH